MATPEEFVTKFGGKRVINKILIANNGIAGKSNFSIKGFCSSLQFFVKDLFFFTKAFASHAFSRARASNAGAGANARRGARVSPSDADYHSICQTHSYTATPFFNPLVCQVRTKRGYHDFFNFFFLNFDFFFNF